MGNESVDSEVEEFTDNDNDDDFVDMMQSLWHVLDVFRSLSGASETFSTILPKWFISIICI